MASMSTQKVCTSSSSSSSFSTPIWKYDIFLNFYGEDTRKNFTDHLYANLKKKSINVYRDNENLEGGKPIAFGLMKAIEESKYAIIVLSKNYAFSKWCLNELVKILECMKEKGLKVRPIFYHVYPSDVGNQRQTFEKAFLKHEGDGKVSIKQMQEWRTALKEVSKIRGRQILDSHESEDIQEITKSIFDELNCELSDDFEHLIGINSRVKEIMNLFSTMSDDVHFIGIWGMPGIGKTTLAHVIYNRICHLFEASSFICDIRETVEKDGLVHLQKQLLSETLMVKEVDIWDHLEGIKVIKKRLNKKVLIVLDDVDKDEQLKALAGSPDWFGPGSRIIITSKDKHLLKRHHLGTTIHRVNGLDNDEALELFSWTVFNQPYPKKEFEDLSNGFVKYAKGLPIALKVLSSPLIDRPRKVWEDYMHQLEEIPEGEILDKLEISYRGLNEIEQNLFLDIACFFKGEDENRVAHIEGFGSYKNMETLKDKSLITILERKLWMHDLIQEMAWRVVHRESPQEPGRRSRLWLCKDVFHVLKENTGTEFVEGMVLNSPPHNENLNDKAFSNMISLRLLKISNVHLPKGLNFLSNKLRMMEWHDYPLKFMPISFQPDNLVELIMPRSHIKQLPEGFGNLAKLRLLDLSDSKYFVKTPNFNGLPILERLILQGCSSLYKLHLPVGALNRLNLLNLKACKNLKTLPCKINLESLEIFILSGCSSLKEFSEIGTNMTRLSELYLDGTGVKELPLSIENLTGLSLLSLQDCKNFSSFPSVNLPSLKTLILSGCDFQPPESWLSRRLSLIGAPLVLWTNYFFPIREAINMLLHRLRFIASLNLNDCNLWDGALPDDLSGLSSLQDLDLSRNNFTHLPDSISKLSRLKQLWLSDCSRLQSLPNLPLSVGYVTARRCTSLENYSNQNFVLTSGETGFTIVICDSKDDSKMAFIPFPNVPFDDTDLFWERFIVDINHKNFKFYEFTSSTEISEWFSHQSPDSSVTIPLPSDLRDNSSWTGIALFSVVLIHENFNEVSSAQDYKVIVDFIYRSKRVDGLVDQTQLKVFDVSEIPELFLFGASSFGFKVLIPAGTLRDHLEECSCITASIGSDCPYIKIKNCGARVVYKQDLIKFPQATINNPRGLLKQDLEKSLQAIDEIYQRFKCEVEKVESSKSDGQNDSNFGLKGKLKSMLLRLYQGDLARNHIYDYVFPHITVPNWFSNRSICSDIRIKLPRNLHCDGRWMGIAVCAYYTVKQPAMSGDNQDLTSFLNFYTPLASHRVHLTRHRVFQDSKDIFVESSHRILVFYIPHLFLWLEESRHIGASFEHNNSSVKVRECGIRLVYEQDVEEFMETLVQCMLGSPEAYHDCFYQNLSHQVDNRKDFGCSASLQRMPQPTPKLLPSIETIAEGCTSSETSPSFTGFLLLPKKGQHASIMSTESLKTCLQKNFDDGEIFNCCFAEREIPRWFCYRSMQSVKLQLCQQICNNPDWMGFALCGLFFFNLHPTVVRTNLHFKRSEVCQFRCKMSTDSCPQRLVCYGLLSTGNELVSLNQRAFIWVMFIPRTTHAYLWSQSTRVQFWLESSIPDLSIQNFGINLVYQENVDELTRIMVQCSAPFDSFLDSCSPQCFYDTWDSHPEVFVGTKSTFENLHPQRLFISQEENSGTAKYSYDEDPYPHNHFRYFHPSTAYNSCFPTRQIPKWFNHQSRGQLVTIDIPPNLYNDCNWLGLTLCASFLIRRDQAVVLVNSSHFLYCRFQMSKAGLGDQILVCRTTDEENQWLIRRLKGHIWISYIPGEAFKHMLHQGNHIEASFVCNWPGVTVQKCGFRLLYKHDRLQFEQELKHCNTFISAHRDFTCQVKMRATELERYEEFVQVEKKVKTLLNKNDLLGFDGRSKYSHCFPLVEILHWFNHYSNGPSVTMDIYGEWMGLVLCVYFSIDEHQTAMLENFNSTISHYLVCHLETNIAGPELVLHVHCTTKEEFIWLDTEDGFLWLSYIPRGSFPDRFNQCTWIKASIISDWPGVLVQKCGLSFYHMRDNWFQQIRLYCNNEYKSQDLCNQVMASYIEKTSRAKSQLCKNDPQPENQQSNLLDFDRSCYYNSCFPSIEIPRWFHIQSDGSQMTLNRELYNGSAWIGVALCALFAVRRDVTEVYDIIDSKTSYNFICHWKTNIGSVRPRHIYRPTKEDLTLSQLGGFIWLSYIPRESFPDWLSDCAYTKVSFQTNCLGLTVQKCGLRLLYQHSQVEFKKIITDCMNSLSDFSSFLNQMKLKNRNRKMRSWIESQRGENDPHHKDQSCKSNLLGFDRCLFYNPSFPPSEILEWFSHRNDEHWVTIPLPPNLYNDIAWMGLVLCASFAVDVDLIAHLDILYSEYSYHLAYQLETNVATASPHDGYHLTKENHKMLQQGRFIWLSYIPRGSLRNHPNQCSYIKASITTNCPGLTVEQCRLRLVYSHDGEEFKKTIGDPMKSSSDDSDLIHQLTTDNGNRYKQKDDDVGTSCRTSSSREESNFGNQRGPIDREDKGKGVLKE